MNALTLRQVLLLLLGLAYIGVGLFIFVKKVIPTAPWSELLALLFVSYGCFRVYRAIKLE